jgi:hypothetical protein
VESLPFWKIADQSLSSTSSPSSLCSSLCPTPPPSPANFPSPAAPRRSSLRHVPLLHRARCFPASAGPPLAPPRRTAAARACHAPRQLPAAVPACPCPLLDLKHVPELPVNSLLPSRTHISTAFLLPERYASLELRCSSCSMSSATSAASHPRSSAPIAPPQPTEAHRPIQFHFPALQQLGPQRR